MGTENFNRQFILLDFRDLDNPEFLAFVRAPEFSTYLLMRRHIWRSRQAHYMGLHELYGRDHLLACSLERERIAEQLGGLSTRTVSNDLVALERRDVIRVRPTGRQNIYLLGWWGEEDGVYYEVFYADRLQRRGEDFFRSDVQAEMLPGRGETSFRSEMKLSRASERKEAARSNREEQREEKRAFELSKGPSLASADARAVLADYAVDLARELRDEAPLPSTTTRLFNLYLASGLALDEFIGQMMAARRTTQQRTAGITKQAARARDAVGTKNKMPYFFGVLADLTGATREER